MKRLTSSRSIAFLIIAAVMIWVVTAGCENAGASGGSSVEYGDDPTTIEGSESIEIEYPSAVADPGGTTYTFYVLDRDTDIPITSGVNVEVSSGTPPTVFSDGSFTLPSDSGRVRVTATGYEVLMYVAYEDGKNLVRLQPLYEEILGQWILYDIVRQSDFDLDTWTRRPGARTYDVYDERVTYGTDGIRRWAGAPSFQSPITYYAVKRESNGNISVGGTINRSIGDMPFVNVSGTFDTTPPVMVFMGFMTTYYPSRNEILRVGSVNNDTVYFLYNRDGQRPAPDPGIGTGSYVFRGATYTGAATDVGTTWGIVSTTDLFPSLVIEGVSTSPTGTASVAGGLEVTFMPSMSALWYATSGTATRNFNQLTFSFQMREIFSQETASLTGSMTITPR